MFRQPAAAMAWGQKVIHDEHTLKDAEFAAFLAQNWAVRKVLNKYAVDIDLMGVHVSIEGESQLLIDYCKALLDDVEECALRGEKPKLAKPDDFANQPKSIQMLVKLDNDTKKAIGTRIHAFIKTKAAKGSGKKGKKAPVEVTID